MNQMERMYQKNAGNCAKGGRDPAAQRSLKVKASSHKPGASKRKQPKRKKKKEKLTGTSEKGLLAMLLLAKRAGRLNGEQYQELKELVTDGDDADLSEAIALRRQFVDGTCETSREERDLVRMERTKEKILRKITELQVRVTDEKNKKQKSKLTAEERKGIARSVMRQKHSVLAQMKAKQQALAKMRHEQNLVLKHAAYEGKYTKAIPSTFSRKEMPAFDARKAENIHHTGSHYVMGSTKAYLKGARIPGMVARHSRQAAIRNGKAMREAAGK